MTYDEFKHLLAKAGLTAREFAELVGLKPNSVTNQARGDSVAALQAVTVTLMAEMAEQGVDFRGPLSRLEKAPNKPRGGAAKGKFGGSKQMQLRLSEIPGETNE